MRNKILLMDNDSGGLLNESTLARTARVVARHAMVLPFKIDVNGLYRAVLRSRADTPYAIARAKMGPKRRMSQALLENAAFIRPAARVDPADLSRFEGEGGPEAPEPGTHRNPVRQPQPEPVGGRI